MSDGFLSRWSRRKIDAKEGREPPREPAQPVQAEPLAAAAPAATSPSADTAPVETPPPPTLEDVAGLTPESDYSRFAARDVAPEVKNAALKKLFSDPRYNVQDGLDVYIDDYTKSDPIPESMLRQMASAQFLKLFEEKEDQPEGHAGGRETADGEPHAAAPRDDADNPTAQSVAQSGAAPRAGLAAPPHADTDLRLQQDDAAPGEDPGRGAG